MKTYSQADVMQLGTVDVSNRWAKAFLRMLNAYPYVALKMKIPYGVVRRTKIICNDILRISDWKVDIDEIVKLLLEEFVNYVCKTNDPRDAYSRLSSITSNIQIYIDNKMSEHNQLPGYYNEDFKAVTISLERDIVLRIEYLLADMECFYPDHPYTVEIVITHLLCDFVKQVQTQGKNVLRELIKMLDEEDEE
ncbi:hypothetical protein [Bacillus sp. UNCCL81]|uniref:hypothetical protein n=1 Tax=Bacillus sp. UNCCL81 TaxID=1502755 RepID=UPI0003F7D786|nr:hypothetical protein [Bacillus sp. UNCCL81]SFD60724.1 hypothetical protein SAMN02799633_04261 [Bacillus sp. UNCCL81]